jgi:hypothetical protein
MPDSPTTMIRTPTALPNPRTGLDMVESYGGPMTSVTGDTSFV